MISLLWIVDFVILLTWKYVIFPKTYYPTEESIGLKTESMFDFKVTQFELEKKDKVLELENFL